MEDSSEARIHFELYRHLQNAIDVDGEFDGTTFSRALPEYRVNGGLADIVVLDERERPFLVIEAKRPSGPGLRRDLDPYSPRVIRQAFRYAAELGADYFATYNGTHLVLFETYEAGTHLLDRRSRSYEVTDPGAFAPDFLREVALVHADRISWDPHHEAFVKRLKTYHSRLAREFEPQLDDRLGEEGFRGDFEEWVAEQGWKKDYSSRPESVRRRFLSQGAYLLMNKLLFYKLLEDSDAYQVPEIDMEALADPDARRSVFARVVESVDFEAVYQHDPIFDALSLSAVAREETEEFLEEIESYDLGAFDHDVIGQIYQGVIPAEERHGLGQYYTPPEVVRLINRICVTSGGDRVLDPGCGSGSFLVDAYRRLRELDPSLDHEAALDQIHGVDINRFPAHLSAINLALRDLDTATHQVNIEVADFFNVDAIQGRLSTEHAGVRGEDVRISSFPTRFDAVVANPPYIRQEQIAHKDRCRRHLGRVGGDLNRRSDIYAYFFTHATEFLGDGGRLGFLTSNRWLNVGYGEALQEFFLDKFRVRAIVNFSRQLFDIALIGTCVAILERCEEKDERDEHVVRMLQVREPMSTDRIVELLEEGREAGVLEEFPTHRIATERQGELRGVRKWDRFFRAPPIYWELLTTDSFATLAELADVSFALKTGANDFFYFRSRDGWEERGIPEEFVRSLLKHAAQTDFIEVREEDLDWYVLDLGPFAADALRAADETGEDDERIVKDALEREGHRGVLRYIRDAEAERIDERASVQGRRVWFDLGDLPTPPIVLQKEYWRDRRVPLNRASAVVDQRLYSVQPRAGLGVSPTVLAGVLNSSVTALMREMHGRTEQGEGMNRNTLATYEAEALPVLDLRRLNGDDLREIEDRFEALVDGEREADAERLEALREDLDLAVMAAVGMESETDRLREAVRNLVRLREVGAGQHTTQMVEPVPEEGRRVELRGARRLEGGGGRGQQLGFDGM